MHSKFLILLACIFIALSCEKSQFENTGTITGADMALCACCGGYFVEIEGIKYRFTKSELPSGFTFDDNKLPLKVNLNWELNPTVCPGFNWIKISAIE